MLLATFCFSYSACMPCQHCLRHPYACTPTPTVAALQEVTCSLTAEVAGLTAARSRAAAQLAEAAAARELLQSSLCAATADLAGAAALRDHLRAELDAAHAARDMLQVCHLRPQRCVSERCPQSPSSYQSCVLSPGGCITSLHRCPPCAVRAMPADSGDAVYGSRSWTPTAAAGQHPGAAGGSCYGTRRFAGEALSPVHGSWLPVSDCMFGYYVTRHHFRKICLCSLAGIKGNQGVSCHLMWSMVTAGSAEWHAAAPGRGSGGSD